MLSRINSLRAKMAENNLDAVFLTSRTSHRYFTKFDNEDGYLLITKDQAFALEDFRYVEVAEKLLSSAYAVKDPRDMAALVNNGNISRLGFEDLDVSVSEYERFKELFSKSNLVPIGDMVVKMRQVKDSWEALQMEQAQIITDMAFEHILGILSTDLTETDIAAELEYFMKKHGAEDKSFDTISISAEKTSLPHGVPSNTKIKKGFFTMDFGATINGYHSDMTRTVCIGKADDEMKKLYNTVLDAQLKALEYLENGGKDCVLADKTARDIIDKDYKGYFGHSLGHSVGLEVHESPALSPKAQGKILVPGNIVTVEPGIYIPGKYGTRIEDMVLICENGIKNFTKSPKNLIEL